MALEPGRRTNLVPAPQSAIGADQPLALAQLPLQPIRSFGIHHSHLTEPTAQGRRRLDEPGQRPAAGRQIVSLGGRGRPLAPVGGRSSIQAAEQIIAKRGGERISGAVHNIDQIDDRAAIRLGPGEFGERLGLRLELLQLAACVLLGLLRLRQDDVGIADAGAPGRRIHSAAPSARSACSKAVARAVSSSWPHRRVRSSSASVSSHNRPLSRARRGSIS